jgi:hypothetical protein
LDPKYELKAGAIVALLLKAYLDKENIEQELTYVVSDLDLTEDAYDMLTVLAGMASTSIILLANQTNTDPIQLWSDIMTGRP